MTTPTHDADTGEHVLPGQVLARVRDVAGTIRHAEAEKLLLACEWTDAHPLLTDDEPHPGGPRAARREREAAKLAEQRRIAADWLATQDSSWDYRSSDPEECPPDPWLPEYAWDCIAPLAAALGLSTAAGGRLADDALFLRHRMPRLWRRTIDGEVDAWRARRIAQAAWRQPADVVDALDREVTPRAHSIGVGGLDRLVDDLMTRLHAEVRELDQVAALEGRHVTVHPDPTPSGLADITVRADYADALAFDRACGAVAAVLAARSAADGVTPAELDVRRAQAIGILADPVRAAALLADDQAPLDPDRPLAPGLVLHVHLSDGALLGQDPLAEVAVRPLRGSGGTPRTQLADLVAQWAGRESTSLTVKPVIDLTTHHESRSESPTEAARDRAALRRRTCAFPFCDKPATACDTDHCVAAAAEGRTCDCNLMPLCRHHHRLKTHSGWGYTPLETDGDGSDPPDPDHPGPATSWLWRSPHGMQFLVDALGTRDVTDPHWTGGPIRSRPPDDARPRARPHPEAGRAH